MSLKKIVNLLFVFFTLFFNINVIGQSKNISNKIKLTDFLSKLSEKHKVFFTYDAELLKSKQVDDSLTKINSLELILNKLRSQTNLYFDNIHTNYYVIYNDSKKGKLSLKKAKEKYKNQPTKDANFIKNNTENILVKGKVINTKGSPLLGVTIVNKETKNGTTTESDGTFSLEIKSKTYLKFSHVGYSTKEVLVNDTTYITIILEQGEFLEEIHLVGSRNNNRTSIDAPSAIDVININETIGKTGQVELNQLLQYAIPSFNSTKQSGADGSDHIDPATLRGLGPDQTLVLINGKRRHQSSLINLYGTRGRGNSGTDLNTIPTSAIKRIEVLRDGASAQYGSDAIAGVINIILKDDIDSFTGNITYGFNNAEAKGTFKNTTKGFDGNTIKLSGNYGMNIGNSGFLSFSTEFLSRDKTQRPGADFRKKYGQAGLNQYSLFLNSEIPINTNLKAYANAGYSYRDSESYAFTRKADSPRNVIEIYPNGFNPLITAKIIDKSLSLGINTKINNWNIDINNTIGINDFHYYIKETLNATLGIQSPTNFDAGGHSLRQNTTGIDFNKYFKHIFNGVNIAFGSEYRIESYKIYAGEINSYATFDRFQNQVTQETPINDIITLNGIPRPGGSQGFPGYSVDNEVDRSRSNLSLYVDTEFDFTKKLMLGGAFRYEKYSDFGNTFNYKFSARYKVNPNFKLRSSFSTGFRAPSLAQIYYNLKFTNFIGSVPSESLLEPNDSPVTRKFGIGQLKEEKALNTSLGFTAKFKNFKAAIDGYYVSIKDRIILTGNFDASSLNADFKDVQFFANGVNTKTYGLDFILSWQKKIKSDKLEVTLTSNFNNMNIDRIKNNKLNQETFFGIRDQFFLLASAPKSKNNLNISYKTKRLSTNISFTRFSSIKLIDWQILRKDSSSAIKLKQASDVYASKITTDINLSYLITSKIAFQMGANNIFNIYPTQQQSTWTDSGGYWDSVQMGTNGTFYYSKITYNF